MEQQEETTIIHQVVEQTEEFNTSNTKPERSASLSIADSASARHDRDGFSTGNNVRLPPRNSNSHRSLEVLPRKTSDTESNLVTTTKSTSLEFNTKPVQYDNPDSIYVATQAVLHPASQYQGSIKGWLEKKNPGKIYSFI